MPVYLSRNEEGDVTNHLIMAKTRVEEKAGNTQKSPKKKPNNSASIQEYPFKFYEKNTNKRSLEGKFKPKLKTAVTGTEHTVTTEDNKIIHRKLISQPINFQEDSPRAKVAKREASTSAESKTLPVPDEINAGNRHMLRNVDGKYSRWSEVLEDILKGKIKLQNADPTRKTRRRRKGEESSSDSDSDFDCHDTSEKGRYAPITTNPENEVQTANTPEQTGNDENNNSGENYQTVENSGNTEISTRKSSRQKKPPNRLGGVTYIKNFLG